MMMGNEVWRVRRHSFVSHHLPWRLLEWGPFELDYALSSMIGFVVPQH
jgi:hypothetical protein